MTDALNRREQSIREAFEAGRMDEAASLAIEAYGREIMSFLRARFRSRADAEEAYSQFTEQLWTTMPRFTWRCSMRTWAYALARNVSARHAAAPEQRPLRNVPLSLCGMLSKLVEHVRSATHGFRKTDVKDRFRALREQLSPDDQMLLVLRVDREMSWRDVAITMSGDEELDGEALEREAARLRKAFERVKRELKAMAEREGLLPSRD